MKPRHRHQSRTLGAIIPRSRAGRRLGVMAIIDAAGTGLFLAGSTLFFIRSVGLSGKQVGLGLALAGLVSLVTTVPIGGLADRFGPRRVLIVLSVWRAAGFACYALIHSFGGYLVVVCVLGVADKAASPVLQALVGRAVAEDERVATMASVRALRNVGFTIGAAAAGIAIAVDTRPAYLSLIFGNALSFVLVAALVSTVPLTAVRLVAAARPRGAWRALGDRRYTVVALLNSFLAFHMTLLAIAVPLWVAQHARAPRTLISPLIIVNAVLAIAFQVRAARGAGSVAGAARAQWRAGLALAACCGLLAMSGTVPAVAAAVVLVGAVVALTAGELFQSAGGWGLSYALADPGREGSYLALFSLGLAAQQIVGPTLVTAIVIPAGAAGWLGLGVALAACGAASVAAARWTSQPKTSPAVVAL